MAKTSAPRGGRITSRLSTPILPEILWRERLFERLAGALKRNRVVWLFAPPGAGKTTLAASFIQHHAYPTLWYQLDDTDSDPAAFFQYLAEAAEVVAPGARAALPQLGPEYLQGLPAFTRRFCDILFQRLPSPCTLVLDNYQELAIDSPIHALFTQILDQALTGQHLIVASRQPPPKHLARLSVNQRLELFDWEDIRFTPDECGQCLALKGITDPSLVAGITRASDGWVAGLILMHKTGKPLEAEDPTHPDHQLVFDYFAAEALRHLPGSDAQLLVNAALFASFSAHMLALLCKQREPAVAALLTDLHAQRFFIERHHRDETCYKFHPLFQQYLLSECRRRYTDRQLERLQRRAARIALAAGQVENAAQLMAACRAWQLLARLCLEHAEPMLHAGRHGTLLGWLEKLPEPLREKYPRLRLWHGCAQLPYEPVGAAEKFEQAYQALKTANDITGRYLAWAFGVEGIMVYAWDNFNSAPFWLDELEDLLAESSYPSLEIECRILLALLSLLIWAEGGTTRFPWLIDRCYSLLHQVQEPSVKASLAGSILYFHNCVSGDARAGGQLVEAMHDEVVGGPAVPAARLYWYTLYLIHCELTGQYDSGLQAMEDGFQLIEESGVHILETVLASQATWIYLVPQAGRQTDAMLEKVKSLVVPERRIEKLLYLFLCAARHVQFDDDPQGPLAALEEGFKLSIDTNAVHPQALFADLLCHNYLQLGRSDQARYYFDHLKKIADRSGNTAYRYQLLLLEARITRHSGDTQQFKQALARALRFGKNHRIIHVFGQLRFTTELFGLALCHGIEEEYVRHIIQKLRLKPASPPHAPLNWPWPVRITTLNRFSIEAGDKKRSVSARQKRVLEVLILLITEHQKPLSKEYIKRLIWPEADADKAEQSFKSTVSRLRKLLGADAVIRQGATLYLDKQSVWVDCWEVERQLKRLNQSDRRDEDDPCQTIRSLYRGPLLQGEHHYWLSQYLEKLHKKCCAGFVARARELLNTDQTKAAIQLAHMGLDLDPTLEELYQVQISAYINQGNTTQARKAYQSCSQILARELKSLPSPKTRKLFEGVD